MFNYDTLAQRLRELAFLNKGLKITLTDERVGPGKGHGVPVRGRHRGVHQASQSRQSGAAREAHPFRSRARAARDSGIVTMEVALQYNDGYSENVFSFANNINTVDGGTHLTGFRTALTRTINAFGQQAGLFKDVKENLSGDDVREGLTAVVSVKVPQPQFEGQTKGKLNSDIAGQMTTVRQRETGRVFRQEPRVMSKIVGKAIDAARAGSCAQGPRPDAAQGRAGFRRTRHRPRQRCAHGGGLGRSQSFLPGASAALPMACADHVRSNSRRCECPGSAARSDRASH